VVPVRLLAAALLLTALVVAHFALVFWRETE